MKNIRGFIRDTMNRKRSVMQTLLLAVSLVAVANPLLAQQAKPQTNTLQNVQSLVARQAALVSEFDVNGLKVLVKRREGSLTVAAGLFIKEVRETSLRKTRALKP